MADDETICEHIRVLEERIARERELREALIVLMGERDRRYDERFSASEKAVQNALTAQEKLTNAAFTASEKAIGKAESAQISYNATHNDLTRKMDSQYKEMLPRSEADAKLHALEEKIADLRESRSVSSGRASVSTVLWALAASIAIGLLFKFIVK